MSEIYNIELVRDGLHRTFGGGIPKGALTLIEGPYGSGKSAVSQRLAFGFLKNGHSVTYISTELTTKGFVDQMHSLDYPIVDYVLSRELMFIPVYPLIGKARSRYDFLHRLMGARGLFDRDVTIIDTFSSLVKDQMDPELAIESLAFFKKITGLNKTVILTCDSKDMQSGSFAHFESDSDLLINLKMASIEGTTTRILFITRYINPNSAIVDNVGFRIEPKVGFIIDITSVA